MAADVTWSPADSLGPGEQQGVAAAAYDTLILPPRAPRVVGYLRFLSSTPPPSDDVLRATAAARGYRLVAVVRSTDVSTLTSGCPGIGQILRLIEQRKVDGVLTLADYTIAWDQEVVRRIADRIRRGSAFLDYVWPQPPERHRPTHPDRNRR